MNLFLKWFAILWSAGAIGVVIVSNLMIALQWPPVLERPFDVQDHLRVALLLAPGAAAAIVQLAVQKWRSRSTT